MHKCRTVEAEKWDDVRVNCVSVSDRQGKKKSNGKMFCASTAARMVTGNVNVTSKHVIKERVRKLAEDVTPPGCEACEEEETAGFLGLAWTHCTAIATWMEADCSSTVVQRSGLARHICARTTRPTPGATPFRAANGATIKTYGEKQSGSNVRGKASTSISRLQTPADQPLQSET